MTTPPFKKMSYTTAWSEKYCKVRKSGGKFVALLLQCGGGGGRTDKSTLLRASLASLPSRRRSFISQFLQIGPLLASTMQDLKLVWLGSAGGAMIINPIS